MSVIVERCSQPVSGGSISAPTVESTLEEKKAASTIQRLFRKHLNECSEGVPHVLRRWVRTYSGNYVAHEGRADDIFTERFTAAVKAAVACAHSFSVTAEDSVIAVDNFVAAANAFAATAVAVNNPAVRAANNLTVTARNLADAVAASNNGAIAYFAFDLSNDLIALSSVVSTFDNTLPGVASAKCAAKFIRTLFSSYLCW